MEKENKQSSKESSTCVLGIPEGEEKNHEDEKIFEEIMVETIPNLVKDKCADSRSWATCVLKKRYPWTDMSVKLKNKIMKATREKMGITQRGNHHSNACIFVISIFWRPKTSGTTILKYWKKNDRCTSSFLFFLFLIFSLFSFSPNFFPPLRLLLYIFPYSLTWPVTPTSNAWNLDPKNLLILLYWKKFGFFPPYIWYKWELNIVFMKFTIFALYSFY